MIMIPIKLILIKFIIMDLVMGRHEVVRGGKVAASALTSPPPPIPVSHLSFVIYVFFQIYAFYLKQSTMYKLEQIALERSASES